MDPGNGVPVEKAVVVDDGVVLPVWIMELKRIADVKSDAPAQHIGGMLRLLNFDGIGIVCFGDDVALGQPD